MFNLIKNSRKLNSVRHLTSSIYNIEKLKLHKYEENIVIGGKDKYELLEKGLEGIKQMRNKLRLIVNNNFDKGESFFIKKELRSILNLYAKKVSSGDWKDYGLSVNKKEVTFDVYQRSSEKPVYRISKNLNPKRNDDKFYILDRNGKILKKSDNLENLIRKIEWNKLKLVK